MQPGAHDDADASARVARLASAVPHESATVLQVGAGSGWVAAALKSRRPAPSVIGVDAAAPDRAASDLDAFHRLDLDRDPIPVEEGSIDCIVYAQCLPALADPVRTLRRHRPLLSPSGTVVCSVPNAQHHSVVRGLLRGVLPYAPGGLLDPSYRHLLTSAATMQLLLDAGYLPDTFDRVEDGVTPPVTGFGAPRSLGADTAAAGAALFELLGVGIADAERDLSTSTLVVRGLPQPEPPAGDDVPVTFVACVNDDEQLGANLARSPGLGPDGPHELLVYRGCANAAEGLNAGLAHAAHDFVVFVHQDVYVPAGWATRLVTQWREAERLGGTIGIAGVFGVLNRKVPFDAIGRVVHRDRLLSHRDLPADVDGIDEVLMVVPRSTPLRVDPELGWHLYGTDLALQARGRDLRVVVLDAPIHHNSLTGRVPVHYRESERVIARKWPELLPIHTNLSSIDSWLVDAPDGNLSGDTVLPGGGGGATLPSSDTAPPESLAPDALATLVGRLRREQVALNRELEQARLQVASMKASPFWRARERVDALRRRLRGRR